MHLTTEHPDESVSAAKRDPRNALCKRNLHVYCEDWMGKRCKLGKEVRELLIG